MCEATQKNRKTSPWNMFLSKEWSSSAPRGSPDHSLHLQALRSRWKDLAPAAKAAYIVQAEKVDEEKASYKDRIQEGSDVLERPKAVPRTTAQDLRNQLCQQIYRDVQADAIWERGLGLARYGVGLKPSAFDAKMTAPEATAASKDLFSFALKAPPNPPNIPVDAFRSCHIANHGVCRENALSGMCSIAVNNLHGLLSSWSLTAHEKLPALLSMEIGQSGAASSSADIPYKRYAWVTRCWGVGETQDIVEAELLDSGEIQVRVNDAEYLLVACTSQCFFLKLFNSGMRAKALSIVDLRQRSLHVTCWRTLPADLAAHASGDRRGLVVQRPQRLHEGELSLAAKMKLRGAAANAAPEFVLPFGLTTEGAVISAQEVIEDSDCDDREHAGDAYLEEKAVLKPDAADSSLPIAAKPKVTFIDSLERGKGRSKCVQCGSWIDAGEIRAVVKRHLKKRYDAFMHAACISNMPIDWVPDSLDALCATAGGAEDAEIEVCAKASIAFLKARMPG